MKKYILLAIFLICSIAYAQDFQFLEYDNSGLADNDIAQWNSSSSKWEVIDLDVAASNIINLSSLKDTAIASASIDEILRWDGTDWVDSDVSDVLDQAEIEDLSDVSLWTDYSGSITLGASGGTLTSTSVSIATHKQVGDVQFVYVEFNGTCGSTPDYLTFTLPTTPASGHDSVGSCIEQDGGGASQLAHNFHGGSGTHRVYGDATGGGFADGACYVWCNIWYKE